MSASTFQVERTQFNDDPAEDLSASTIRPSSFRFPSLTVTVPKELVHRASVAEVVLTDWQRIDETRFLLTAQWPRGHSFFTPVADGYHDPLIGCETIRQIGMLLGHAEFGVPLGHQFIVWDIDIAVRPLHLQVGWAPAALDIEVTCTEIKRRGRHLSRLRFEAVLRREGNIVATGGGSFSCMAPGVYRRVRGDHTLGGNWYQLPLISPAAPQSVGRMSPMDVVLSPTGERARWQLRVDTRHPILFEHAVDHVPGMVLLEAARQATASVLGRSSYLPLSIATEFKRYAELDSPCMIEAVRLSDRGPGGEETVLVTGLQDGVPVFSATVTAGSHGL
ncbi:ScbA/BarX family gamma-butyrolactone biosynthesis protein [Streptomyces sp. NBC_01443]|uniref:ScbA/BarX family gamma-butyrolactone biosynthesis protein n=1 Tax=Streptomyces sp. NBC_01443 TaxID=2903868 RepID=UPI0022587AD9|nr:ScbA/BarX family gamma-butyrolactone biosynthesis protein [Streptomyces sp. NBC_01443]MCX4633228.1 ScbA/BarX family gamma-butyrolactone biosynthesis protein [Streptomyces sp. NBC_01443]